MSSSITPQTLEEMQAWTGFFTAAIGALTPELVSPGLLIHETAINDDAAAIADDALGKWRGRSASIEVRAPAPADEKEIIRKERERCALIAESSWNSWDEMIHTKKHALGIAAAIREEPSR